MIQLADAQPYRFSHLVEVDEVAEAERLGIGQLDHQRPALGVTDHRRRVLGDRVHHGDRVADVGVPAVERGMVAVAVTALIPGDHPPSGGGQLGCEDLERAAEIEPSVHEEQRRRGLIAPFVDRQAQATDVDLVLAFGRNRPWKVAHRHAGQRMASWKSMAEPA